MATFGPVPPFPDPPPAPATDDIWIRPDGLRQRWTGFAWQRHPPDGQTLEGSVLPPGGTQNNTLAKRTGTNWDAVWVVPTTGILYANNYGMPDGSDPNVTEEADGRIKWQVFHELRQYFVSVTVVSPGDWDPDNPDQTVIHPEAEYISGQACQLYFHYPAGPQRDGFRGTAYIRR